MVALKYIFVLLLLLPVLAQSKTAQEVYRQVNPSIFTIYSVNSETQSVESFGSAVAIKPSILATNCHILFKGDRAYVEYNDQKQRVRLVYKDVKRDICLLQLKDANFPTVPIRRAGQVQIGEPVYAIGNPMGLHKSLSRGIISNKHSWRGINLLQTDASIAKGSSGGGLFDSEGRLIGLTTLMAVEADDISLAIPSELIMQGLQQLHDQPDTQRVPMPQQMGNGEREILERYNNNKVLLVRHRHDCFIFIFNKSMDQNPDHSLIWWPDHPRYLFIYPKPKQFQKGVFRLSGKHPIMGYQDNKERSVLFAQYDHTVKGPLKNHKQAQFIYKTPLGKQRVLFNLQGFGSALSAYNQHCK